jgi:hypothetical protein
MMSRPKNHARPDAQARSGASFIGEFAVKGGDGKGHDFIDILVTRRYFVILQLTKEDGF